MSVQHTPGPWFLEGDWSEEGTGPLGGWVSSNPPAGMPVFELGPVVGERAEIAANARLIAAAPDLLAALEEVMAAFAEGVAWTDEQATTYALANAAIAKATGA